ncbi:NADH-quinone oxidoreductase subunit E [Syntrophotalea acetylenivorans]|uniref:NADH-quinone oxidoreductase subunit E n=1 Tax=Syntrophotalea acetylenivorans TaxID=1842532 RepID=A0A1L3GQ19_9BACT|nr:NADH-quinone oxidoreductase subunit NuoE [Syntrophotalea acetylenivorans]APG28014.1 NADH-quinone oxidoreductase subunit E [Syntrophotalea acetylenivorans]
MSELLSPEEITELKRQIAAVHEPRELIVEVLQAVQKQNGWVSDAGIELAAELLGLSPLQVDEVATFYDKIYRSPVGSKVIHVCDSICCWTRGAEMVYGHLQQALDIAPGETTSDGIFTLLPTCCLGACGNAPSMRIGDRLYSSLTIERIDAILDEERQEALK